MNQLFSSIISFVIGLFFFLLGIVAVLIPWFSTIRETFSTFIQEQSLLIFLFGIGCLLIAIAIFFQVIYSYKKRHYEVRSGQHLVKIDETLFQDYLNTYWKQLFPHNEIPNKIELKKNKIYIEADLPYVPELEQKSLLERIERDLSDMFTRLLGYQDEYIISITFMPNPTQKQVSKK